MMRTVARFQTIADISDLAAHFNQWARKARDITRAGPAADCPTARVDSDFRQVISEWVSVSALSDDASVTRVCRPTQASREAQRQTFRLRRRSAQTRMESCKTWLVCCKLQSATVGSTSWTLDQVRCSFEVCMFAFFSMLCRNRASCVGGSAHGATCSRRGNRCQAPRRSQGVYVCVGVCVCVQECA